MPARVAYAPGSTSNLGPGFDCLGVAFTGKGDRVEARLVHQPHSIRFVNKDDVRWLDREVITDWQVLTKLGTFGPGRAADMRLAIDSIVSQDPSAS